MNEDEVMDKLEKYYDVKRNEALAIVSMFRSNFTKQRRKLNKGRLDNESLNEVLHWIAYACKERETKLYDFRIIIKSFGDEKANTPDPLYLAEKYELYKLLIERFGIDIEKVIPLYYDFRAVYNAKRVVNGERQLTYKELDAFIERIIPSYSSLEEFVKDFDDLKEDKGRLMKLVHGNPLEALLA